MLLSIHYILLLSRYRYIAPELVPVQYGGLSREAEQEFTTSDPVTEVTIKPATKHAVGEVGMANEDITQVVHVIPSDSEKLPWLLEKLPEMIDQGDTLVFASKKATVDEIESQLAQRGFKVAALHGDKDQASRMDILQKFKSGLYHVLIATDVAARGLDIKSIKSVVNFDIAKDMDMHVHRIGRTGRAGDKDGVAYTLITLKEARFAGELVNSLVAAGQNVSVELMDLAMKVTMPSMIFFDAHAIYIPFVDYPIYVIVSASCNCRFLESSIHP